MHGPVLAPSAPSGARYLLSRVRLVATEKENRRDRSPVATRGFTKANDLEDVADASFSQRLSIPGSRDPSICVTLARRCSRCPDVTRTCTQRFRLFRNGKGHVPRSCRTRPGTHTELAARMHDAHVYTGLVSEREDPGEFGAAATMA